MVVPTKDARVTFRLTEHQDRLFRAAAAQDGRRYSDWLRWLASRRVAEQATEAVARG